MHLLFYEQVVFESGTKMEKGLLDDMMNSKLVIAMGVLLFDGRSGDNITTVERTGT